MSRFLVDREEGETRPLEEYQALFPGHEAAIAEEFRELLTPAPADSGVVPDDEPRSLGPYELVREVGRGGQGTVWLAEDTRMKRRVAIKVVPRSPLLGDLSPRLRREAELTARLDHPGICAVYDVGVERGVAWLAMRFVDGRTIDAWGRELPPDPSRTLAIVEKIEHAARALHAAHEVGIVHRDIKPGNIMIARDGTPVILDFGVAHQDEEGLHLTLSGDVLGTPAYMSPEQLEAGTAPVDRRSDVWALGVTLHELLIGRRPFEAPTRETLIRSILEAEPPYLRELRGRHTRDLEVIIRTALEKDLDRRYGSALDFAEDLRRLRAGEPIRARPASAFHRLHRWARRNPALASTVGVLFVVLVAAYAVTSWSLFETKQALAERQAYYDDVVRLADQRLISDLLAQIDLPRPLNEETAPDLAHWLDRARDVTSRTAAHRRAHEAAQARLDTGKRASPDIDRDAETDLWFVEQISLLLADIEVLDAAIATMEQRLDFARNVRRLTIDEPRAAWDRAIANVAADPRFGGFALPPQPGLVPLGPDPDSGFEEFAHLQSGVPARRDPASGQVTMRGETGLVLVLLPGGSTMVGAALPMDGHPEGSPHVDPFAGQWDGPPQRVRLDPFFLSKYEMTQGQWNRQARSNPSNYVTGTEGQPFGDADVHPVEQVSANEGRRVLAQLGLVLPTEVQWEYGARGGTTTVWWTGNDILSVQGAGNFADEYARNHGGHDGWLYNEGLDDGWVAHAPVGLFRANAFGLHDTLGNVGEWTDSTWEDWAENPPRDGDGLAVGEIKALVWRGGAFTSHAKIGRSGMRDGFPPDIRTFTLGLRPARPVSR